MSPPQLASAMEWSWLPLTVAAVLVAGTRPSPIVTDDCDLPGDVRSNILGYQSQVDTIMEV